MNRKTHILRSNEAYNLITNAIAQNRKIKDGKLLTPSEVEELIYYLLKDIYKDKYIRLTNDNENEQQRIIDQLRYGDIVIRLPKEDLNVEVKSEKPYKGLYYRLRIDLVYREKYNITKSYDQENTNNDLGWAYKIGNYDKIYVHFHDPTNKYKFMVFVINNPWKLYIDCMEAVKGDFGTYNINQVEFDVFRNNNDRKKTTINASFNLLDYEARVRYNIDLIYLEVRSEE